MKIWVTITAALFLLSNVFGEVKARAENGDAEAQFKLGYMYSKGREVAQDFTKAFDWTHKATEQGTIPPRTI